ncbi:hypothetical protein BM531_22185, partial [Clostridioides difficile]
TKRKFSLNQNWSWDKILRSCFIKQADVLQGIYYFGNRFTKEEKREILTSMKNILSMNLLYLLVFILLLPQK